MVGGGAAPLTEYWLYDPTGERIRSRLCAMRLETGRYRELAPEAAALEGRYLPSTLVGLDVRVDGAGELHVRNPVIGEEYLRPEEEHTARLAAKARAGREAAARAAAEAQVAKLQARLRGGEVRPSRTTIRHTGEIGATSRRQITGAAPGDGWLHGASAREHPSPCSFASPRIPARGYPNPALASLRSEW